LQRLFVGEAEFRLLRLEGGRLLRCLRGGATVQTYDKYSSLDHLRSRNHRREFLAFRHHVLDSCGIDVDGLRVLDVSGGPGMIARSLAELGARVTVTEFTDASVAFMRDQLDLDTRRFDYNADRIETVVDGPFDLILVRASINFCRDLDRFAQGLSQLTVPGGLVCVDFSLPTLGTFLRWQFDRYTYLALYPTERVHEAFARHGFAVRHQPPDIRYWYMCGLPDGERLLAEHYAFAALPGLPVSRDLHQVGRTMVFAR